MIHFVIVGSVAGFLCEIKIMLGDTHITTCLYLNTIVLTANGALHIYGHQTDCAGVQAKQKRGVSVTIRK